MGRSERKRLKSNVTIVLLHLLKWQYQPQLRSGSWKGSIIEHRQRIRDDLADSPSLKPYLQEIFSNAIPTLPNEPAPKPDYRLKSFLISLPILRRKS